MKYVLGVDGGNTKADFALFGADGTFVDGVRGGTCSHEAFDDDYDITRDKIGAYIGTLLDRNGLSIRDIEAAAFGLAGSDFPHQNRELCARIQSLGFTNFKVANDSLLGIKAAAGAGVGLCSINGTGTTAGGMDKTGRFVQVGGIGLIFGDEGGGSYIAGRGIRLAYDHMLRCGEYTSLSGKLLKLLGLDDDAEGRALFAERYVLRDRSRIKTLDIINAFYAAAAEGDRVSLAELERIGGQIAMSVGGCLRELDFSDTDEVDVVMAGSVWAKSSVEFIHNAFKSKLALLTDKRLNFIKLTQPPVVGAVLWALELADGAFPGGRLRESVIRAVSDTDAFKGLSLN